MKKHIKHIVPILVAGSGFILTVRAGAATPSNSSFELPDPSLIGYYGTTPTLADQGGSGWGFYSEGNASAIGKPDTYWGVGASPDGGNFGVMQYASGIHQNVTPGAGLSTVSFYALANDDGTNIDISLGGTALKFGSGTPISIGNSSWTKYTSVVASVGAGNQTLLFGRNGAGGGNASSGTYIDGISYQRHIATANYNFESPDATAATYGFETPSLEAQGGGGWTFDNSGGSNAGISVPGNAYYNPTGGASPVGGQFAYLKYGAGMHQNVTLNGGPVTLSFYALANDDNTNIDIKLGSRALTFSRNPVSISNSGWALYTSDEITVGAGTYNLLFGRINDAGGGNASSGTYIDGVYLTQAGRYNFESPDATAATYGFETPSLEDQGGGGWTFDNTGGSNAGISVPGNAYYNPTGGASPVGGQFAYLKYGGGMHLDVPLNGGTVTLSFYALAYNDNTNIDIKLGGTALTFSQNPVSISNSGWALYTSDEIAVSAGTYNLLFGRINNAGGGNASDGTYIDGVYLTQGAALPTYGSWSTANNVIGGPDQDSDNDGVLNGVEYFMNAAAGFTANPGLVNNTVTWPNGGNIPSSAYGSQFVVQTSANLVNWTDVPGTGDANLVNTSSSVTYTLTGSGTKFVRLKVTPN
jgi:hypothetical protein